MRLLYFLHQLYIRFGAIYRETYIVSGIRCSRHNKPLDKDSFREQD